MKVQGFVRHSVGASLSNILTAVKRSAFLPLLFSFFGSSAFAQNRCEQAFTLDRSEYQVRLQAHTPLFIFDLEKRLVEDIFLQPRIVTSPLFVRLLDRKSGKFALNEIFSMTGQFGRATDTSVDKLAHQFKLKLPVAQKLVETLSYARKNQSEAEVVIEALLVEESKRLDQFLIRYEKTLESLNTSYDVQSRLNQVISKAKGDRFCVRENICGIAMGSALGGIGLSQIHALPEMIRVLGMSGFIVGTGSMMYWANGPTIPRVQLRGSRLKTFMQRRTQDLRNRLAMGEGRRHLKQLNEILPGTEIDQSFESAWGDWFNEANDFEKTAGKNSLQTISNQVTRTVLLIEQTSFWEMPGGQSYKDALAAMKENDQNEQLIASSRAGAVRKRAQVELLRDHLYWLEQDLRAIDAQLLDEAARAEPRELALIEGQKIVIANALQNFPTLDSILIGREIELSTLEVSLTQPPDTAIDLINARQKAQLAWWQRLFRMRR